MWWVTERVWKLYKSCSYGLHSYEISCPTCYCIMKPALFSLVELNSGLFSLLVVWADLNAAAVSVSGPKHLQWDPVGRLHILQCLCCSNLITRVNAAAFRFFSFSFPPYVVSMLWANDLVRLRHKQHLVRVSESSAKSDKLCYGGLSNNCVFCPRVIVWKLWQSPG